MPKYPRQSVCAVIAFGFTFISVFGWLYLRFVDPSLCNEPSDVVPVLLLILSFMLMHTFALLGHIHVRASPKRAKGGPFLTGTLVVLGMLWGAFAVAVVVAVVKLAVELLGG